MENEKKKFEKVFMEGCYFIQQPGVDVDFSSNNGPLKFEIKGTYGTIVATGKLPELMDLADEKGKLEVMILNIKAILNTDALEKIAKKDGEIKFYINKIKEPKKKVTHFGYTLKPVDGNSQPQKTSSDSEVIKGKNEDKLPF